VSIATEIELKLNIPKSAAARLKSHPLLAAAAPPSRMRLRSIYFDTPELVLREQRAALRVRRAGRTWMQTFKSGGEVNAGLHARTEAECRVAGLALDLESLREVAGAEILRRKRVAGRLIQVFETNFMRTAWRVLAADGSVMEVALDQGNIWSTGRALPLSEVEIELITGDPAALFRLALALQEGLPLRPENLSKAERGYRLFCNEAKAPVRAATVTLTPAMRPAQALQVVAAACTAQLQANADGAAGSGDPEYVHQMRVALRRLRAALGIFVVPAAAAVYRELGAELRALAGEMGTARNWDVFIEQTLRPLAAAFPRQPDVPALILAADERRAAAYHRVHTVLNVPRFARLLLRLASEIFVLAGAAPALGEPDALRELARATLTKQHKRLARESAALLNADDENRHRLRIDAKKLRYAAEFFAGLFDKAAVTKYAKSLAALQEVLGEINDAVTAESLLDQLDLAAPTRLLIEAWLAAKRHQALVALPAAAARVAGADKFWKRK
jgi:inorganic triphosphatase YgiF